jgi:hypothetical protein
MDEKRPDGGVVLHFCPKSAACSRPHPYGISPITRSAMANFAAAMKDTRPILRSRAPVGMLLAVVIAQIGYSISKPRERIAGNFSKRRSLTDCGRAHSASVLALHEIWRALFPSFEAESLKIGGFAYILLCKRN